MAVQVSWAAPLAASRAPRLLCQNAIVARIAISSNSIAQESSTRALCSEQAMPFARRVAEGQEMRIQQRVALVVAQRLAVQRRDRAAGCFDDGLCRCRVPFARRARAGDRSRRLPRRRDRTSGNCPSGAFRAGRDGSSTLSSESPRCERLPTTTSGVAAGRRTWIGCAGAVRRERHRRRSHRRRNRPHPAPARRRRPAPAR